MRIPTATLPKINPVNLMKSLGRVFLSPLVAGSYAADQLTSPMDRDLYHSAYDPMGKNAGDTGAISDLIELFARPEQAIPNQFETMYRPTVDRKQYPSTLDYARRNIIPSHAQWENLSQGVEKQTSELLQATKLFRDDFKKRKGFAPPIQLVKSFQTEYRKTKDHLNYADMLRGMAENPELNPSRVNVRNVGKGRSIKPVPMTDPALSANPWDRY